MADKKIKANFVIEILGRPPEHIKQALIDLTNRIASERGVSILNKTIHEPKKIKESENENEATELYTSFAEVEAEFESIEGLFVVAFNYMPSHIEIINPEEIILKNESLSEIITEITLRLHKYDEIAKKMIMDNRVLESRLKEILDAVREKKAIRIVDGEAGEKTPEKHLEKERKDSKKIKKK